VPVLKSSHLSFILKVQNSESLQCFTGIQAANNVPGTIQTCPSGATFNCSVIPLLYITTVYYHIFVNDFWLFYINWYDFIWYDNVKSYDIIHKMLSCNNIK